MPDEPLINLESVAKIYGHKLIFKNINLKFYAGDTALLTGANGAGKSTLLKLIAGLTAPSAGKIGKMENLRMAYLGHATFLYPGLTAMENLSFWANAAGIKASSDNILAALEKVGLLNSAHELAGVFSRGMAQRLNFARVMMSKPELFLLDEPFTGMDSQSRQLVLQSMQNHKAEGAAILMISHEPERDKCLCAQILEISGHTLVPV